jgi:hypothetical protein
MLFQLKKLPEIINLTRFLRSFWILYIDQIIVYNAFYSKLTFYIIKDHCQMHALKVFRSPVWLLLHKLSSPHYRYICKMRHGDRLPLTQGVIYLNTTTVWSHSLIGDIKTWLINGIKRFTFNPWTTLCNICDGGITVVSITCTNFLQGITSLILEIQKVSGCELYIWEKSKQMH